MADKKKVALTPEQKKAKKKADLLRKREEQKREKDRRDKARLESHAARQLRLQDAVVKKSVNKTLRQKEYQEYIADAPKRRELKKAKLTELLLRKTAEEQKRIADAIAACRKKNNIPDDVPLTYDPKTDRFRIGLKATVQDGKASFKIPNTGEQNEREECEATEEVCESTEGTSEGADPLVAQSDEKCAS